ncbi:hypothetical protein TwortDSMZ_050 [Staphylococcus phage Twort]|uniref:Uncharacterized protein n=1 Tax=Staphylococcus phage Twort (strain DSM 17442 / HER 48) TaxID=2908167 RepID=A0A6H0X5M9_BPTWO|nr:hypothetical protein TwortDSMZ_050 [Staphylococcus phage Twort]
MPLIFLLTFLIVYGILYLYLKMKGRFYGI